MKRTIYLALLLSALLSVVFVLPAFRQVESALDTTIPTFLGSWQTQSYPASEKELNTLAGDTSFSKARCGLRRYEEMTSYIGGTAPMDLADLSVVLSGHDLANSIHRPERCMPAQGHRSLRSSTSSIELSNGQILPVTRILSKQDHQYEDGDEVKHVTLDAITYYYFVGHSSVTESHTTRTLIDIVDRILKGEAQRWAFVSASMVYQDNPERERGGPPSLEMADKKIRQLLKELAERNIDWNRVSS